MGIKYVKDKKGKFQGSVSDGKGLPTAVPTLPKRPQAAAAPAIQAPIVTEVAPELETEYHPRLSIPRQIQLKYNIEEFFEHEVVENEALRNSIIEGKEIGHSIASEIDNKTAQVLKDAGHPIVYEVDDKTGAKKARSFGDSWIRDGDYVNPINVKTGVMNSSSSNSGGNSNMASMMRLKDAYLSGEIDSYYLAITKFDVDDDQNIRPQVFFVDALNYLDHMNYNMGTGQIMMKEKELYEAIEADPTRTLTRKEKVEKLQGLYQRGLEEARAKLVRMEAGESDFSDYLGALDTHSCGKELSKCTCNNGYQTPAKPGRTFADD